MFPFDGLRRRLPRSLRLALGYALFASACIALVAVVDWAAPGLQRRLPILRLTEALAFLLASVLLLQRMAWLHQRGVLRALRRSEAELREREEDRKLYAQVLDGASDAIYAKDLDGRYLLLNSAARRLAGGAERDSELVVDAAQLAHIRAHDRDIVARRASARFDEIFQGPDGEMVLDVIKGPLLDARGAVRGVFGISRDVTEQRRDAQRLRLWGESFAHAAFGLAISDVASNTFVAVNPAFAEQRGWSPQDLVGRTVLSVFPADERARVQARLPGIDAAGHGVFESEHQRRDGSRFPVQIDVTVLGDAQGRPVSRIAYAIDISARRAAQREVQRTQELLRTFIATAPIAIALFDRDMRYLAYSDRWLLDYGRGRESLLGVCHYEVNPDLPQAWLEVHQRGLRGETQRNDEDLWVMADGTRRWVRWAVVPWRDSGGAIAGLIMSAEDITDAKRVRDAVSEREARYRAAVESASDGFWVVDLRNGRLLDVNDAYARASGYSREQLLRMSVSDLEAVESADEVAAHVARVWRDGRDHFITRHRRRDGSTWPVEIHVTHHAEAGDNAYAFVTDIGERLALERRILDAGSAEQERLGREIHDGIGQQISAVALLARGLQQRLARGGQEAESHAAGELVRLLQRTLREARLLARGLAPLDIAANGLGDALTLLVHGACEGLRRPKCRVELDGAVPELPGPVALHLYRVAQEALHNALRHAHARHIVIALHGDGDALTLHVRDDGRGLPERSRDSGLGLSTLAYRARAIGASLRIDTAPGQGTAVECRWAPEAAPHGVAVNDPG